jgi:phage shock protein A
MKPLDALLVPPALIKRALDDVHDIATLVRRYAAAETDVLGIAARLEREIVLIRSGIEELDELLEGTRAAVEPLSEQIAHMEQQLDGVAGELAPMRNLEPIRRGIEPLEHSMVSVRESVDELEPMIMDLDRRIQSFDPRLEEMQAAIEPIGDLAEKVPGNRRRRAAD